MIEGFEPIQECPVSAITPEAREAVAQFERIEFARESTGAVWRGTTLAEWPPADVEVSILLASEQNRLLNAKVRSEAVHAGRSKEAVTQEEE